MSSRKRNRNEFKPLESGTKRHRAALPDGFATDKPSSTVTPRTFVSAFVVGNSTGGSSAFQPHKSLKMPLANGVIQSNALSDGKGKQVDRSGDSAPLRPLPPPVKLVPVNALQARVRFAANPASHGSKPSSSAFVAPPIEKHDTHKTHESSIPPFPLIPCHGASASKKQSIVFSHPPRIASRDPAKRRMKTITTTNVALATDVHSDSGGAELLSIFVQQHAHEFLQSTDRELTRGLDQSPEKRSKTKELKFMRGGLADRAQNTFRTYDTQFRLWNEDLQRDLRTSKRVSPDLHLRIVSVLYTRPSQLKPSWSPAVTLLRCANVSKPHSKDYLVFLSFGTPATGTYTDQKDILEEGTDVHIWQPWYTMDLSSTALRRATGDIIESAVMNGSTEVPVLACSRFRILSPT